MRPVAPGAWAPNVHTGIAIAGAAAGICCRLFFVNSASNATRSLALIACHSLSAGKPSPNADAANLAEVRPTREEVRRAIIDGRPGMPKGLVGGDDVDRVADYVVQKTAG